MAVPLIKYPLDLTGAAPSNLIAGETHDLSNLSQKAFVLNYGPFYTRNLVVRNLANGAILTPKTQYVATQLFVDMTLRTGLDICSVIVITDPTLPANLQVSVDAQMLGGEYSASVDALQQLIDALDLGNQPVLWADVLGRPIQFPPSPHLHDLGDVYGFEYLVAVLERIVQAIYVGDEAQLAAIYQYIDHEIAVVQANTAANAANLTAHLVDYTNPHRVSKSQVGLGSVDNFATATDAQAVAGVLANLFMTPASTAAVTAPIVTALNAHVANVANPHNTTKAQVGLGNVDNFATASTVDAQTGTATNLFMTPSLTAAAITTQALTPLNTHIANSSNPHNVTKAQVGLGNVDNFATATPAQGAAGTSSVVFMTPASTAAAVQAQAGTALAAHIADTSNPHATTKAQVGLGSVDNFATASTAEAQAGTATNRFMTPALTKSAIATQALTPLNAHIADTNNPHAVTAAQVGAYTKAQSDTNLNNTASGLQIQINSKQPNLGYTPVRQGGGAQQLTNVVYIGHSNNGPRLQVDSTDFGPFSFLGHQHVIADVVGLQGVLDSKASIGSSPRFSAVFIGADNDIYLYEAANGSLGVRHGTAGGGYKYSSFDANGNLSIGNGALYAANGFQPSDRRLKKNIKKTPARALWREFDFKTWLWKADDKFGLGAISQDVKAKFPEYTGSYDTPERKGILAIDKASLAFEMSFAAGKETDGLRKEVDALHAQVEKLTGLLKRATKRS